MASFRNTIAESVVAHLQQEFGESAFVSDDPDAPRPTGFDTVIYVQCISEAANEERSRLKSMALDALLDISVDHYADSRVTAASNELLERLFNSMFEWDMPDMVEAFNYVGTDGEVATAESSESVAISTVSFVVVYTRPVLLRGDTR